MTTFIYDGKQYDMVDPVKWTTLEAIKLEQYTSLRTAQLMGELADCSPIGAHAGVWISLRRAGLDIAWHELDVPWLELIETFKGEPAEAAPDP